MTGDERGLRAALRRSAEPAETQGVYEEVARRRVRYRIRKRAGGAALVVLILAGAGAATWTVARSFGFGGSGVATPPPVTEPAPPSAPPSEPGPTTAPAPSPAVSVTPGPPSPSDRATCDQASTVRGDFDGDGELEVARLQGCGERWLFWLERTFPGRPWAMPACSDGCALLAAPDLNGDGTDELAVVTFNFSIQSLMLFEATDDRGPVAITVASPGDPVGRFEPGKPAEFGYGGDAFTTENVRCEDLPDGPVLIATTAESLPHDRVDARWHVHQTVLRFVPAAPGTDGGSFEVVDSSDFTLPTNRPEEHVLFADHEHFCGAPAGP